MGSNEGYEKRDVRFVPIIGFGFGLVVSIVLCSVASSWLFKKFFAREAARHPPLSPLVASERPQLPIEPRLEVEPSRQLKDLREHEDHVLHSYGWVDREAGIVRIPVERAIDLLIERGLPARAGQNSDHGEPAP
jgi:hypothetical protein